MQFSERMIIVIVLVLIGLLVLLFSSLNPETTSGSAGSGFTTYLPIVFR